MAVSLCDHVSVVRADVDTCVTHVGHANTVRESVLKAKGENPLPHRGFELGSVLRLVFRSDALPKEPHPIPSSTFCSQS